MILSAALCLCAFAADTDEDLHLRLYEWMIHNTNFKTDYETDFHPVGITGEESGDDCRIYHLFKGMLEVIEYDRVGNRVLVFGSSRNLLAAAADINGSCQIMSMSEAYASGIINDDSIDKLANGHGIWVYTVGDADQSSTVDVNDMTALKNVIAA